MGFLQRITNSCLSRQMDDHLGFIILKNLFHVYHPLQIYFFKAKARIFAQPVQSIAFQLHVIIIIQIIDPHNPAIFPQQTPTEVVADKTRRSGYQYRRNMVDFSMGRHLIQDRISW